MNEGDWIFEWKTPRWKTVLEEKYEGLNKSINQISSLNKKNGTIVRNDNEREKKNENGWISDWKTKENRNRKYERVNERINQRNIVKEKEKFVMNEDIKAENMDEILKRKREKWKYFSFR